MLKNRETNPKIGSVFKSLIVTQIVFKIMCKIDLQCKLMLYGAAYQSTSNMAFYRKFSSPNT